VDRSGIVYFGRFFEYCHIAYEEMLSAIFGGLEGVFGQRDWGMPLVHAEADYQRPMRLDDTLTIELSIARLGGSSVTFAYRVLGDDGEQRATAQLVHAFVDMETFKGRPAPDEFRQGVRDLGLVE
jgi:YbgC/YbaW family acyl-CoA thioester hydrolase